MFILPDPHTLIVQLINFAIFFALLNVVFLRPVGEAIRKRREYIDSVVNDYAQYQSEGKTLREQAEKVRAEARRTAEAHLAKVRNDASNEAAKIATEYSQRSQGTIDEAHKRADAALAEARSGEATLVDQLASTMVERALGSAS
ncbi:MAG TPA: ATP synthase F0 subunit B [Candidatus Tumulicola sp.]